MSFFRINRDQIRFRPLSERVNKVEIERDKITSSGKPVISDPKNAERISRAAREIQQARKHAKPVMMSFGAHAIKNGLAPVIIELTGGVYLPIGSAVMSPMIFEKSLSMAQNIALQKKNRIKDFSIYVVDLAKSTWDWQKGEPPATDPAYYLRYLKTFSRMGENMHYISMDNRDFLVSLFQKLC